MQGLFPNVKAGHALPLPFYLGFEIKKG